MTTIEELERRCAAGESIVQIAQSIGVTKQCVSGRLIKSSARREAALNVFDLRSGDWLREKDTGHRWQYFGPAKVPGLIRVSTEGGANSMDMSLTRLERAPKAEIAATSPYFNPPAVLFTWVPGTYGPHTKQNQALIDHAMEVRKRLDQDRPKVLKADPDANLRATTQRKAESRKRLAE